MKFLVMLRTARYFRSRGFSRRHISDTLFFFERVMQINWLGGTYLKDKKKWLGHAVGL